RPAHIENSLRRPSIRFLLRNREMRWRLGHPIVPGNKLHVATAFPRATLRFRIAQKVLQGLEHQRTEAPASWIGALQKLTFKQYDKKILCQVLGVRRRMSQAANEREDRSPVYFAKFRQRPVHLLLAAVRVNAGKHNTPACRSETTVRGTMGSGIIRIHRR